MPPKFSACFFISTPPPLLRLKLEKFSHVFVAGLATNYCCKFTAIDTKRAGFVVMLLLPLTCGVGSPFDPQPTVQELERSGARVLHDVASLQW
jgi:nicotinamidase/pyrazinamidase